VHAVELPAAETEEQDEKKCKEERGQDNADKGTGCHGQAGAPGAALYCLATVIEWVPAMPLVKLIVILMLIAIVFSLGSALFHLSRGKGDSGKMVKSLTWRIGLSVVLFLLLLVAYWAGLLQPHAI
jgi:hypothetical protein